MKDIDKTVVVVGAGAAGLIAAGVAARGGAKVILCDKNAILAKKVRITGKGRCNITNSADIDEFIKNVPINGRFLHSAFAKFTNNDLMQLLHEQGVEVKTERGGRVFPVSDKAKDVADALVSYARYGNTKIINKRVTKLLSENDTITGVGFEDNTKIEADSVIIATGGKSYPLTGSTGDGYRLATSVGHTITELRPALVPLVVKEKWINELMGLSLKNVSVTLFNQNKKIYTDFGEMLFTHFGLSGPIILSASTHIKKPLENHYTLSIDLKPALSIEQLDKRIQRDFEKYINKHIINSLDELMPKKLIPIIVNLWGVSPDTSVNQVNKNQRMELVKLLKNMTFEIKDFRPIDEAIITCGGVSTKEINPSTMESKVVSGLYFAGEIIDTNAYTGGYNLQIAFSTGFLAGSNA